MSNTRALDGESVMTEIKRNADEKQAPRRRLSLKEYRLAGQSPPVCVPTEKTISTLWPVLNHLGGLGALLPPFPTRTHLVEDEWAALCRTVLQAAVVAIDAVVAAGEHGGLVTKNKIFDALAARWSQAFQRADATRAWDMKPATVERAWRDVLARGINFDRFWGLASRSQLLYRVSQLGHRGYQIQLRDAAEAWSAIVARDPDYHRPPFSTRLRLVNHPPPVRVFDADGRCVVRYETAGEWRYNLVEIGEASERTLRRLEDARVTFDVAEFRRHLARCRRERQEIAERLRREFGLDVDRASLRPRGRNRRGQLRWQLTFEPSAPHGHGRPWPTDPAEIAQVRRLRARWLRRLADEVTGRGVSRDLARLDTGTGVDNPADGPIELRSAYTKTRNKRCQALDFWPVEVTGKDKRTTRDIEYPAPGRAVPVLRTTSRRGRWFTIGGSALVGRDIMSSQYQTLAVLTGDTELEARAATRALKREFADETWLRALRREVSLPTAFRAPDDPHFVEACKALLLRRGYNGVISEIARELARNPEAYGPGLGTAVDIRQIVDGSALLRNSETFNAACREVARRAWRDDPNAGVILRDPCDGSRIRWNPIHRGRPVKRCVPCWKCVTAGRETGAYDALPDPCRGHTTRGAWAPCPLDVHGRRPSCVSCTVCGRCWKTVTTWEPVTVTDAKLSVMPPYGTPNAAGDYPVNITKLMNMVAPSLIHALDSMFSALVIDQLATRDVEDVVAIHDNWLVAAEHENALEAAIAAAGEPWLLRLGPVYEDLARYLAGTDYEDWWAGCWARWRARCERRNWPRFGSSNADPVETRPVETAAPSQYANTP